MHFYYLFFFTKGKFPSLVKPPHPSLLAKRSWGCPIPGSAQGWTENWGTLSSESCACPWQGKCNCKVFKVLSNPNPPVTLILYLWSALSHFVAFSNPACPVCNGRINKTAKIQDKTFLWIHVMPGLIFSALLKTLNGEIFPLFQQFPLFPRHLFFSPPDISVKRGFALNAFSAFITHSSGIMTFSGKSSWSLFGFGCPE